MQRDSIKTGFFTLFFAAAGAVYALLRGFQLRIRLELEHGADSVVPDDDLYDWAPPVENQWQEPLLWNSLRPGAEPAWTQESSVRALPAPRAEAEVRAVSDPEPSSVQEKQLVPHPRFQHWNGVWVLATKSPTFCIASRRSGGGRLPSGGPNVRRRISGVSSVGSR